MSGLQPAGTDRAGAACAAPTPQTDVTALPLISIVMPVYNVEDYLALTVDSVRGQTYPAWELICVDDGSRDGTPELLAELAADDERIHVITQPNRGVSTARNVAMAAARGDYVCFLDSDDLMVPEACEIIAAAFEASEADVVIYGGEVYPPFRTTYWHEVVLSPADRIYEGFDPAIVFEEPSRPYPWKVAFRRAFLNGTGIRFNEALTLGEDQVFLFQILPLAKRTAFIADKLVRYRIERQGSLMQRNFSDEERRMRAHIDVVDEIASFWRERGLLEGNEQALFDWLIEFLVVDLLSSPDKHRPVYARALRSALERSFDADFLADQRDHPAHGFLVRALLDDETADAGGARTLRLRYYGARYGWPSTLGRSVRTVRDLARQRLHPLVCRLRGADPARERERAWEAADKASRDRATLMLRATHRPEALRPAIS